MIERLGDWWSGKPAVRRDPAWSGLRRRWLKEFPTCAACGRRDALNVHHIVPVHVDPKLELDWRNLLTLCEHGVWNCHLMVGHAGNWKNYRPGAKLAAAELLAILRK